MNCFAVIGHPVAHSLSPAMHAANFASIGYEGTYEKFDVAPEDVESFVLEKRKEGYLGLNVTVPHKFAVIPLLDRVDESVSRYGSCNTLKFCGDGAIEGWNTDVAGFVETLSGRGISIAGKSVLVVGCGGAGSAIASCSAFEGASRVAVAARRPESVANLVLKLKSLETAAKVEGVSGADVASAAAAADIVVNATPVGLKPGDGPVVPAESFHPGQFVLDIIPTKEYPPTASAARDAGALSAGGLEFLVAQGAKSFEIWTGLKADRDAMLAAVHN